MTQSLPTGKEARPARSGIVFYFANLPFSKKVMPSELFLSVNIRGKAI